MTHAMCGAGVGLSTSTTAATSCSPLPLGEGPGVRVLWSSTRVSTTRATATPSAMPKASKSKSAASGVPKPAASRASLPRPAAAPAPTPTAARTQSGWSASAAAPQATSTTTALAPAWTTLSTCVAARDDEAKSTIGTVMHTDSADTDGQKTGRGPGRAALRWRWSAERAMHRGWHGGCFSVVCGAKPQRHRGTLGSSPLSSLRLGGVSFCPVDVLCPAVRGARASLQERHGAARALRCCCRRLARV